MAQNEDQSLEEDEEELALPSHRAPALLAVVRIVSVLGMSFCIAFGIFLLLFPRYEAVLSFLAAIPFLFVMRFFEKYADKDEPAPD